MPKRRRKSNQGCCLTSLILWPFQILEEGINSLLGNSVAKKPQVVQRKKTAVPKPQRTTNADRFVSVTPAGRQASPSYADVSIHYEGKGTSFIKAAQKLRDRTENHAELVPFKCYWPTYSDMDVQQQRWYFYWRSQARRDNFLPTDLSYIFIHIYELLNLVETPDPVQAAARIRTLWLAYRGEYPNLDHYLAEWGGDLLAVKAGITQALEWWANTLGMDGPIPPASILNAMIDNALRTQSLEALPYKLWTLLSDYHPKNKFYQKYNKNRMIDLAYGKAILVANTYYLNSINKTLIDQFVPTRTHHFKKQVFTSALIGFPFPREIQLGSGRDYVGATRLAGTITSIMKYTENILRKQFKFSAKLSGIELPSDLAQQLDLAFQAAKPEEKQPEPAQPVSITLDHERVAALQQESRVVSEILATEPESTEKELLTDLEEARTLWKALSVLERRLLTGLFQHELNSTAQVEGFLQVEGGQAAAILESINKKSLVTLGDKIIYEDGTALILAEDFTDELEVVIRENPPGSNGADKSAGTSLDPWLQFFDSLEPVEVEITKLLGQSGQMKENDLDAIARAHRAMGNAVMDSLNEKAQVHLEQLPFYPESGYWLVEEEYLPVLRQHLGIEVN